MLQRKPAAKTLRLSFSAHYVVMRQNAAARQLAVPHGAALSTDDSKDPEINLHLYWVS